MAAKNVVIVGGGIVGLATAYCLLQRYPDTVVSVLEKETDVGLHQTGHNSGVLHSGIYYKPGSIKAMTCRSGKKAMEAFCAREEIPFKICGKVIVATNEAENARLPALQERGRANGIDCRLIDRRELASIEPHAAGIRAIHVPETGITDYLTVCGRLSARIQEMGGKILTRTKVTGIHETSTEVTAHCTGGDFPASFLVNCAGLYSDRVASYVVDRLDVRIVPFRGEYYKLKPGTKRLCNGLIYPLPDPNFPFLGVHFTPTIHGDIKCGPNAVLAFAREGYRKWDINIGELFESLTYPGFLKVAGKYWRTGLGEMWRSFNKSAFVKALQRLSPEVTVDQLGPGPAGVRAQAVSRDGRVLDDFAFQDTPRVINVINAPSPAATASLSIGTQIVEKLAGNF